MKTFFRKPAVRRAVLVTAVVALAVCWYGYGILGVVHMGSGKGKANGPNPYPNLYAARRAQLQALAVDPTAQYPVTRVIDGDTFVARIGSQDVTVRVLGENAPETVKPNAPVECYGPEASAEDKELLTGHSVTLAVDPTQDKVDFYGRLLAYVHRDDGLFLEEHMIKSGFAREYTFNPKKPYQYQGQFRSDQSIAQAAKAGLWGRCADGANTK